MGYHTIIANHNNKITFFPQGNGLAERTVAIDGDIYGLFGKGAAKYGMDLYCC